MTPTETPSQFRNKRLRFAVYTSVISKVFTAGILIIAVPMAVGSIGVDGFALFSSIVAGVSWISLSIVDTAPVLAVRVAAAVEQTDRQKKVLASAFYAVVLNIAIVSVVAIAVLFLAPIESLLTANFAGQYQTCIMALIFMASIHLIEGMIKPIEAAQAGFQENYILNIRGILGNFTTFFLLIWIAYYWPTLMGFLVALFLPQTVLKILNAGLFFWKRPYLIPQIRNFRFALCRELMIDGAFYSYSTNLNYYLSHQLPVVVLAIYASSDSAALFAASRSALIAAFGVVSMLCIPLWPAISDSLARNEISWLNKSCKNVVRLAMAYAVMIGLVFSMGGYWIFEFWLRGKLNGEPMFFMMFGLYFVLLIWENVHYMILVGMGQMRTVPMLFAARGVISMTGIALVSTTDQPYLVFAVLSLATLLVTAIPYPVMVSRLLKSRVQAQLPTKLQIANARENI